MLFEIHSKFYKGIRMKKGLLLTFLSLASMSIHAENSLDIEPEYISARESNGIFGNDRGASGVFNERKMGVRGNPQYEYRNYQGDRLYSPHYEGDYDSTSNRRYSQQRLENRRIQDRYYQDTENYYNDNSYLPMNDAESYNDITNPYPGTSSQNTNFQHSNFDNQVWDFNN